MAACSQEPGQAPLAPGSGASSAPTSDAADAAQAVSPVASASAVANAVSSRYTSFKDCKLIEEGPDGEDWSVSQCPGLAGINLQINYSDAREDLALLRPGRKAAELGLIGLGLHGFNTLAEKAEWRGHDGKAGFAPSRLIVRNLLSERGDQAESQTSLLVVIDLEQACVIALVRPEPGQNEAARAIADGPKQPCLS